MGEAKRRKLLDPTYGKSLSEIVGFDIEPYITHFKEIKASRDKQKGECYYDFGVYSKILKNGGYLNPFEKLRFRLLEISITDERVDPDRAPYYDNLEEVRNIGLTLHKMGGSDCMCAAADSIPIEDQRELDMCWDNIGEWRC